MLRSVLVVRQKEAGKFCLSLFAALLDAATGASRLRWGCW